jgi:hypothetical protein
MVGVAGAAVVAGALAAGVRTAGGVGTTDAAGETFGVTELVQPRTASTSNASDEVSERDKDSPLVR